MIEIASLYHLKTDLIWIAESMIVNILPWANKSKLPNLLGISNLKFGILNFNGSPLRVYVQYTVNKTFGKDGSRNAIPGPMQSASFLSVILTPRCLFSRVSRAFATGEFPLSVFLVTSTVLMATCKTGAKDYIL